jgi:hypothetical protein
MKQSFLDVLFSISFSCLSLLAMNQHIVEKCWAVRRENRCTFRRWHRIGQPCRNIQQATDCLCRLWLPAFPDTLFVATRLIDPTNGFFFLVRRFWASLRRGARRGSVPRRTLTRTSFWGFRARSQQHHHCRPHARMHERGGSCARCE